jgi:hypothetical protein
VIRFFIVICIPLFENRIGQMNNNNFITLVINTFISENMTNLFIEGILIFPVTHAILKNKKR